MERNFYFEKEGEFLNTLFLKESILYSQMNILTVLKLTPELLLEKNFSLEYCSLTEFNGELRYLDCILKNKSNIYLYLSKKDLSELSYKSKIYFTPNKLDEVKFFIKTLLKLKVENGNNNC